MTFVEWSVPVKADSNRSNDLKDLSFSASGLTLVLLEEETENTWQLVFDSVQGFRTTTEECAGNVLENIPVSGGFYRAKESGWLRELGKGDIPFMENTEHFIISCYDAVIEVAAQNEAIKFTKID